MNGLDSLTIDGHAIVTNGVFTATSFTTGTGNTFVVSGISGGIVSYSYTLVDNEQHVSVQGNNNLPENLTVVAFDTDGDLAVSTIKINVVDDIPTASPLAAHNVAEGATETGQLVFVQGADGAAVTQVNGVGLSFGDDGYSQVFSSVQGDFQVKADGTYKFVAQSDDVFISGGPANFSYAVTDADGDISPSTCLLVTDTSTDATVNLTASTVIEGAVANYVFTATLSNASHGVTTITPTRATSPLPTARPLARW